MPLTFRFMEVALACSDVQAMEDFWVRLFDARVLFRGLMGGQPYSRVLACGITLIFRQAPDFRAPPGPGEERSFNDHLGLRVPDLEAAIEALTVRGARFVVTPALVRQWKGQGGFVETTYIAPPLTRARIDAGEWRHDVAILAGPDNLWIELNELHEPADLGWFGEVAS